VRGKKEDKYCNPLHSGINIGAMIAPDGREIVFAGAGILWGATTVVRGLQSWFEKPKHAAPQRSAVVTGVVLVIACTAYLAWSLRDSTR
jgi:hypothetical protein